MAIREQLGSTRTALVGVCQMTRTDAITQAILAELRRRRTIIDASEHLSSVTICVRLQDGPTPVRSVTYEDQQFVVRRGRDLDPETP